MTGLVFSWIILAIVVGVVAESINRSFWNYLCIALFLSPIIGFLILLIKGKATREETLDNEPHIFYCPNCGTVFSNNGKIKNQSCVNCNSLTKETTVLKTEWRNYSDGQKEEMKKAFASGNYLRFSQPVVVGENKNSSADEIKKFKELLDMGAITQEEFDAKKKELL